MERERRSLVGRRDELHAISALLTRSTDGPSVLVLEGEPGIGKTTVWAAGVDLARQEMRWVLSCRCANEELPLAYVGLLDLLEPVAEELLPALPAPQRRVLEGAVLLREGRKRADARTVAVTVLSSVRALAALAPVLLAIDDAQWLDKSSASALHFALRRLGSEPVGVLATIRLEPGAPPLTLLDGLEPRRVRLGSLSTMELQELIALHLGAVPRRGLRQLIVSASGNPYFALELAKARHEPAARAAEGAVPPPLRDLLRARIARLGPGCLPLLEAVAAASTLSAPQLEEVIGEDALELLDRAYELGVLEFADERVGFTHPLLAETVREDAPAGRWRKTHARLAEASKGDERARHLGLAASEPDESVSAALERSAGRAAARGAPQTAAELAELAYKLTPPRARAAHRRRAILAGRAYFEAGDSGRAAALLDSAVEHSKPGDERAAALVELAHVRFHERSVADGVGYLEAALAEQPLDPTVAVTAQRDLAWMLTQSGRADDALTHARTAERESRLGVDCTVRASALSVRAVVEFAVGNGVHHDLFRAAVELESGTEHLPVELRPRVDYGLTLLMTDELATGREHLQLVVEWARARADEGALPYVLWILSELECLAGHLSLSEAHAREALAVASLTGQQSLRAMSLVAIARVSAIRGDEAGARSLREAAAAADTDPAGTTRLWSAQVSGFLDLSLGRHAVCVEVLRPLVNAIEATALRDPYSLRCVGDLSEALVAVGEPEAAERALDVFEARGRKHDRASVLAISARCRALALAARGDLKAALTAAEASMRHHERVREPFERARSLLAYGMVLRRANRRREARSILEQALAIFDELGAALWRAKADAELRRIGGRRPRRSGEYLTETERQVGERAARGLTNREIAETLFITVKTVEANLSRIYRKLGVRSRTELARAIPPGERSSAPIP